MDRTLSLPDLVRLFAPAQPRDPVGDGNGTAGDRLSHRPRPGSRPPNAGAPVRLGAFEGSHDRHGAAGRDHGDEYRANPAVGAAPAAPAVRVILGPNRTCVIRLIVDDPLSISGADRTPKLRHIPRSRSDQGRSASA